MTLNFFMSRSQRGNQLMRADPGLAGKSNLADY